MNAKLKNLLMWLLMPLSLYATDLDISRYIQFSDQRVGFPTAQDLKPFIVAKRALEPIENDWRKSYYIVNNGFQINPYISVRNILAYVTDQTLLNEYNNIEFLRVYLFTSEQWNQYSINSSVLARYNKTGIWQATQTEADEIFLALGENVAYVDIYDWDKDYLIDIIGTEAKPQIKRTCLGRNGVSCLEKLNPSSAFSTNQQAMPSVFSTEYKVAQHVINGDFESGSDNWEICPRSNSYCPFEVMDDRSVLAWSGKGSLTLQIHASETEVTPFKGIEQEINLQPNQGYRLSFYYKSLLNNVGLVKVYPSVDAYGVEYRAPELVLNDGRWRYYQVDFWAGQGTESARLHLLNVLGSFGSEGQIVFDRVEIVPIKNENQMKQGEFLDKTTAEEWLKDSYSIVYLANPFKNLIPWVKGNDNEWTDLDNPKSQMKLINSNCNIWAYAFKNSNPPPNYIFYTYDALRYYFTYGSNGLGRGSILKTYFQPPIQNYNSKYPQLKEDWIIPEDLNPQATGFSFFATPNSNAKMGLEAKSVMDHFCGVTTVSEYLEKLNTDNGYQVIPLQQSPKRVAYVLNPSRTISGKFNTPVFADDQALPAIQSPMLEVDPSCGLFAYEYTSNETPKTNIRSNFTTGTGNYYYYSNLTGTENYFNWGADKSTAWILPTGASKIGQAIPSTISYETPYEALRKAGCRVLSLDEARRNSENNPRLNESWSYYSSKGLGLYSESIERDKRIVAVSEVNGLGQTERTLLPIILPPRSADEFGFNTHTDLSSKAIEQYGFMEGGANIVGNAVWSENEFTQDPLGRPLAQRQAGMAWAKPTSGDDKRKTRYLYGCGSAGADGKTFTPVDVSPCEQSIVNNPILFKAVASAQDDGWTISYTNGKDQVVSEQRRTNGDLFASTLLSETRKIYDDNGNLIEIIHPIGPDGTHLSTTYKYNLLGQLLQEVTPDAGELDNVYDDLGRLKFSYRPQLYHSNGQVYVNYIEYDNLGRATESGTFTLASGDLPLLANMANQPTALAHATQKHIRVKSTYDICTSNSDACAKQEAMHTALVARVNMASRLPKGVFVNLAEAHNTLQQRVKDGLQVPTVIEQVYVPYLIGGGNGSYSTQEISPPSGTEITSLIQKDGSHIPYEIVGLKSNESPTVSNPDYLSKLQLAEAEATFGLERPELLGKLTRVEYYNPELNSSTAACTGLNCANKNLPIIESFDYDIKGNVIETQQVVPWLEGSPEYLQRVSVEYDHLNRVSRTTTYKNNGTEVLKSESPVYDGRGRVTQVLDQNNNVVSQNSYDDFGRLVLKKVNVENGNIQDNYAYHPLGALAFHKSSVQVGSALPTEIYSENLTYENAPSDATARYDGLISSITRTRPNSSVKAKLLPIYDALGRLESVRDANHPTASNDTLAALMKYAPDGSLLALNRGTFTAGQVVNNDYIYYNGTHRLNKVTGLSMNLLGGRNLNQADNFAYDAVGRMTSDFSKDMNISWRPDDMPHSILIGKTMGDWTDTHIEMNFAYAGTQIAQFRNRILNNTLSTEEAQFDLLGGKQIRVGEDGKIRAIMTPENGGRRTDLWDASGHIITTNKEFYATDYLGSMARSYQFKNGTWSLALAREYDVWGKVIQSQEIANAEDDDKSFTGQNYEDETGLISFPARRYDADVPRWVSPDMARQFHNLYSYAFNPISMVDPDGNEFIPEEDGATNIGNEVFNNAKKNDFWGSEALKEDLTYAFESDEKVKVAYCDGCALTEKGVIYVNFNDGPFEQARQLRHESDHKFIFPWEKKLMDEGVDLSQPSWHNRVREVVPSNIKSFSDILIWNAIGGGGKRDPIYLRDYTVYKEAGKIK